MMEKLKEFISRNGWVKIVAAVVAIALCWIAWWLIGMPFGDSSSQQQPKPATTVTPADKQPKKDAKKPAVTEEQVAAHASELVKKRDAVLNMDLHKGSLTMQQLFDRRAGLTEWTGVGSDRKDLQDEANEAFSDLVKQWTSATPNLVGDDPAQGMKDLDAAYEKWEDATYYRAWHDLHDVVRSDLSDTKDQFHMYTIQDDDLSKECRTYKYDSDPPSLTDGTNKEILDRYVEWWSRTTDELVACSNNLTDAMREVFQSTPQQLSPDEVRNSDE